MRLINMPVGFKHSACTVVCASIMIWLIATSRIASAANCVAASCPVIKQRAFSHKYGEHRLSKRHLLVHDKVACDLREKSVGRAAKPASLIYPMSARGQYFPEALAGIQPALFASARFWFAEPERVNDAASAVIAMVTPDRRSRCNCGDQQ